MLHLVGKIDSIEAPLIRGEPTRGTLQVVSATVIPEGQDRTLTINGLVPSDMLHATFAERVAESADDELWSTILGLLRPYNEPTSKPHGRLASAILLAPVTKGLSPAHFNGFAAARSFGSFGIPTARFNAECGLDTGVACGTTTLPTVFVYAPQSGPGIADVSELYRSRRIYSLSELYAANWSMYQGPDCAAESESYNAAWMAAEEAAQQMEQVAYDMSVATEAVSSKTCQRELAEGGKPYCVDLFIMSAREMFLVGDNRDFDPGVPWKASRGQLYVDPVQCSVDAYINESQWVSSERRHPPHELNRVTAEQTPDGCVVEWSLNVGVCRTNALAVIVCPSIDGRMVFRGDGNGGWSVNVNEDKLPSRGLYLWNGNGWQVISEREERIWLDLYGWQRHVERIRSSRPPMQQSPECTGQ